MKKVLTALLLLGLFPSVNGAGALKTSSGGYFDNTGRADLLSGGVRMIEINTPTGGSTMMFTSRTSSDSRSLA